jgi:GNAT superfamily N-acetyltransferase
MPNRAFDRVPTAVTLLTSIASIAPTVGGMEIRLEDGTALVVRRIRPEDKPLLADALGRMSDESVRGRFLAPKPRFTSRELRYLTEVDFCDHFAVVATLRDRPGVVAGVARWIRDADDPSQAEAAITVADHLQGRGLGSQLGRAIADAARVRGVRRFTATMLSDNAASHRLFASISARLEVHHAGMTDELVAELAA